MLSRALTRSLRPSPQPQCLLRLLSLPLRPLHHQRALPLLTQTRLQSSSSSSRGSGKGILPNGWNRNHLMALLAILFSATGITLGLWGYSNYLSYLADTTHSYPKPVAKELRKALYYSLPSSSSPRDAVKHFRLALEQCRDLGMDPLSDEVTGIKIELAGVLLHHGLVERGVEVLEGVLDEVVSAAKAEKVDEGARRKLLRRGVGIAARVGEVYVGKGRYAEAEEALGWAVETAVREASKSPPSPPLPPPKDGGGGGGGEERLPVVKTPGQDIQPHQDWLSNSEMSSLLEALASVYESTNRFFLATPLYLHALEYMPPNNCHSVVLMNNLSATLSQQATAPTLPVSREQLVADSATPWAQKALKLASSIKAPDRTEECDLGCAVATHNLAEFAEILGDRELARQRYLEARSLARAMGAEEGVRRAEEGLKRVGGEGV
ncbi:unnamed protein product [Tuber aestivum]|uniref:S5 DRBM domain-containing protein n=1 Tax=Tuber aestivum TaxID=59557 RepID=A0A292Q205_9PEZI|nr:unnamed protein product [Tuber aestivum]